MSSPQDVTSALPLIVCPECHYGFPDLDATATRFKCPRPECGHRWEMHSQTIRAVHTSERRAPRPELAVVAGGIPRTLVLPQGETVIGRDPACPLHVDNRSVSRRHARVVRNGEQVTIEDLGSACGTLVNGRAIQRVTPLNIRDEIIIGGTTLRYAVRFAGASERPEIADSTRIIALGMESSAPRFRGQETDVIPLAEDRISIGREPDRDLVLPDPMISATHALLERTAEGCFLSDVQSRIGTFVNGRSIIRQRLESGDRVQLGPYLFRFDGDRLIRIAQPASFGLTAENLRRTAGTVTLLDGVSLVLEPSEFVGLIGPSGAGKTTLLDALNGLRPAASGRVLVNGEPLYEQYDRLRHHIGYVPQDDIIHRELTVRQALTHAARLRLPPDISAAELGRVVDETLDTLQMAHRADVPISRLSGGQRKRVSVGVELLSRPGIRFLDEPTSGLDPGTEAHLMRLFRRLADQGRTVVCTTHVMENVDLFHKLVVLAPGGRLAYFGPPQGAKAHFGIERFTDLYEHMERRSPEEWQQLYLNSPQFKQLLGPTAAALAVESPRRSRRALPSRRTPLGSQCLALLRRTWDLLRADRAALALVVVQPLVITSLICLVCNELPTILFLLVVSALWFGCSNAAQQIVKERAVYRRERMVNLRLDAYLASKFLPLVLIGALQAALMFGLVMVFEAPVRSPGMAAAAVLLSAWVGAAMGLIISALAANPDKAMSIVPLSLIPQIVLAGTLVPLPEMNAPTQWLSHVVAARWANQACEVALLQGETIRRELLEDRTLVRPLANLFPDEDFLDAASVGKFLAHHRDEKIDRRRWWELAMFALSAFVVLQLAATAAILREQDVL